MKLNLHFPILLSLATIVLLAACKTDEESLPEVAADFTANETTVAENSSVSFTNQSTGSPDTWSWTFAGGSPASSTSQNPDVTYETAGTYTVTLTASNAENTDTETKTDYITVFAEVGADFSASDSVVAVGQNVTFADESVGEPTTWNWTLEGAEPAMSSDQNPTVSYATAGTYDVSLTASNANSEASEAKPDFIRVFELIDAEFSADDTTITAGTTVKFTDESTGTPTQWAWDFEGGIPATSTDQNPEVAYNTPGTYEVTLTASNRDTTATVTKANITVEEEVVAEIPTDGLEFWLQAGSAVTVDANGNVEAWADVSGNNHSANQSQLTRRPQLVEDALNGNSIIRFDGSNDFLSFGNILNEVFAGPDKQFTLFAVVKSSDGGGAILTKIGDSSFGRDERQVYLGIFENKLYHLTYYNLSFPIIARGIASEREVLDATHVFTYQYDGSQDGNNGLDRVRFFIDKEGDQKTMRSADGSLGDIQEGPAQLAIGASVSADSATGPSSFLEGDFAEMILYSRIPTDEERMEIEDYLAEKYGL